MNSFSESLITQRPIKLFLARHGQTEANLEKRISGQWDTPLSERGRDQAQALASVLAVEPLTALYCSALSRTAATASYTAALHGLEVQRISALNEIHLGELQGRALDGSDPSAVRELTAWERDKHNVIIQGGERYADFIARVQHGLQTILDKAEGAVLIVGHRNTNEVIVRSLLGPRLEELATSNLNIKNKYVYEISLDGKRRSIATLRLGGEHHARRYARWQQ